MTWGDGTEGITGAVSETNSLVGTQAFDQVGRDVFGNNGQITALSNGNYVVTSFERANGTASAAGAVTWVDGTVGISGVISETNSEVGTRSGDGFLIPPVSTEQDSLLARIPDADGFRIAIGSQTNGFVVSRALDTDSASIAVSYTHLTLPTTPYV